MATKVTTRQSRGGKPTLKTISQLSGLAVPTVSRALNDAPDIGQDTKRLIRKIADEIGYVPNRAGVRLRTGRTNVISLVMSTDHNNHTGRLIASTAGALRDTPYHLIVTPTFPNDDPLRAVRYIVETGSADAIIMNQITPQDPRVAYLMEKKFPFVTHGRSDWAESHAYFDYDNEAYGRLSLNDLHARGRQHIALVAPPMDHNYAQHMVAGATNAAKANGQTMIRIEAVNSDAHSPDAMLALIEFLQAHPEIDGIVTGSTNAATATAGAVQAAGRIMGEDIDVYTKEASPFLTLLRPELLVCSENVDRAGDFLARAAIHAIKSKDESPMQGLEVPELDA